MNLESTFLHKDEEIFGRGYDAKKAIAALASPIELCEDCGYAMCECPDPPYSTLPKLLNQDPTVTAIMGVVDEMRKDGQRNYYLHPFLGSYIVQLELLASHIKEAKRIEVEPFSWSWDASGKLSIDCIGIDATRVRNVKVTVEIEE